ncbi:hypothetical protein SEA_NATOSALEDA_68 [Rhodococcus phage Natosaleda]|nr:hypothetical protein SEA_NATOSALEDA_68 [Rhodococcus phage Natosaleda]
MTTDRPSSKVVPRSAPVDHMIFEELHSGTLDRIKSADALSV